MRKNDIFDISPEPLWVDDEDVYVNHVVKNNEIFFKRIREKFDKIISNGYTSKIKEKEKLTHDLVKEELVKRLPDRYYVISKTQKETSRSFDGEFDANYFGNHTKKIDITIMDTYTNNPVCFINCKFPIQSIAKNSYNLCENINGESDFLNKFNENIPLFYFNIIPSKTPCWEKGIAKIETNTEEVKLFDNLTEQMKSRKNVKDVFLGMFDDSKMEQCEGKDMNFLQNKHKEGYELTATNIDYKCKYLIYNDFYRFIDSIIDSVYDYEKKQQE